jgi:hypothetical protein
MARSSTSGRQSVATRQAWARRPGRPSGPRSEAQKMASRQASQARQAVRDARNRERTDTEQEWSGDGV